MRRTVAAFVFAAVAVVCAACGGGRSLSAGGSAMLQAQVAAARQAAAAGDYQGALSRLATIRASVFVLRSNNDVSDRRAHEILDAVTASEAALGKLATTTTTMTTTTTTPTQGHDRPGRKHGRGDQGDGEG